MTGASSRRWPLQQLVRNDCEGVLVGASVDRPLETHLGGVVRLRMPIRCRMTRRDGRSRPLNAGVSDESSSIFVEQDVARLQAAVYESVLVQMVRALRPPPSQCRGHNADGALECAT